MVHANNQSHYLCLESMRIHLERVWGGWGFGGDRRGFEKHQGFSKLRGPSWNRGPSEQKISFALKEGEKGQISDSDVRSLYITERIAESKGAESGIPSTAVAQAGGGADVPMRPGNRR